MAELKTKVNDSSVQDFLNSITDEKKRQDSCLVLELMRKITGQEPKMWGTTIVGFGKYHYKYSSGQEGHWFVTGFSPRKGSLTIYFMTGFEHPRDLMEKLGKYKTGKSCLYIKKTEDIDLKVLEYLIKKSVEFVLKK